MSVRSSVKLMGLRGTITSNELKKTYRELAKSWHPDILKDDGYAFKALKEAYEEVKDELKRVGSLECEKFYQPARIKTMFEIEID